MAGKMCALWHPNQTKRHFERAADAQVANIKNQAIIKQEAILQQRNLLHEQIDALLVKNQQEIESAYKASYEAIMSEFVIAQKAHEESLLSLSFFWIYGKGIINAEHVVQQDAIRKAHESELQKKSKNNFYNLIFRGLKTQNILKYEQKLAQLDVEKHDIESNFGINYKGAVQEEITRFSSYISKHKEALESLASNREEQLKVLDEFISSQKQSVEMQYNADINSIDALAKQMTKEIGSNLQHQLKTLNDNRNNMVFNGTLIVGAALVAFAAPEVLAVAVGNFTAGAVQISAATTALGAANNLFSTLDTASEVKEFVVEDITRFVTGDTTKTAIFFEGVGKFMQADFNRLRKRQATVIGSTIEKEFKAMANLTSEELAAHLGHEIGNAFLLFLAGGGIRAGGRALTKTMDVAIGLSKDFKAAHTFHSPILFQFQESKLYNGLPLDAIKLKKPIKKKNGNSSKGSARNNFNISAQSFSSKALHPDLAHNVNSQINLNKKLRALQNAQKKAVRTEHLSDGRIRYYLPERASKIYGPTRGASYVVEHNPKTGQVRSWNECYDHQGNVNRIHPKTIDGQDINGQHYPLTKSESMGGPKL